MGIYKLDLGSFQLDIHHLNKNKLFEKSEILYPFVWLRIGQLHSELDLVQPRSRCLLPHFPHWATFPLLSLQVDQDVHWPHVVPAQGSAVVVVTLSLAIGIVVGVVV